jgi:hypothetical protein
MQNNLNNNIELGDNIIDNRLCGNTKTQYKRKVKHFFDWINLIHPELLNEMEEVEYDNISIKQLGNIQSDVFKEFFGHICKKKSVMELTLNQDNINHFSTLVVTKVL